MVACHSPSAKTREKQEIMLLSRQPKACVN
jgi:hypothetical protein